MKLEKTKTLIIIFAILTLIALLTLYTVHQNPIEETITNTVCAYTSTADYDYTAMLKTPNLIYNNKTTLKPDEGTIYTKITRQINLTLTYNFQTTLQSNATITYNIKTILKTSALTYTLSQTTPETTANQNVLETETTLDESIENNETVKEQLEEEAEELVLEALNETIREEIASAPERTESKEILVPESVQAQKYTSLESDIESTEEIEETLHSIEQYFSDLPLEKQEEIMPRYIKLRTFLCKDKKEKDFSCVGCLIGNTIDCPLFKPEPK